MDSSRHPIGDRYAWEEWYEKAEKNATKVPSPPRDKLAIRHNSPPGPSTSLSCLCSEDCAHPDPVPSPSPSARQAQQMCVASNRGLS